jgi:ATP-binding cassette subfamily B protein AbcA/BmrA
MEIIDSHTHIGEFGQWKCSCETLIACMKRFGVSQGIVSTLSGNEFNYELNLIKTNKDQIAINDKLLQKIKTYEGKLKALFWIRPYSENADIKLENVSFKYNTQDVLSNVDMVIPKGKVTAIVGPSGSGKTTILSLLERLYVPQGGKIKFGDTEVESINLDEWRNATGYIQQNSPLLSGTIRDNITYGMNRDVKDEEVFRAAKLANAYDFIMKLPEGFDTNIGQLGGKLSGGERQRIALTRMIIKDPDYLLLDEATSSLDAENESQVQAALDNIMKGKTAVVVAHNMKTVVNADNIIVLDGGKVQASGKHDELYKKNNLYKQYFDLQFNN